MENPRAVGAVATWDDEVIGPACGRRGVAVRAVLFDAVGTLLYPDPPVADVYHAAGRRHGSRRSLAEIATRFTVAFSRHRLAGPIGETDERSRWRSIVYDVFNDVRDASDGLFAELWEHFANPASWRTFDDVEDAWTGLERRGIIAGIASNFDQRLVRVCRSLPPLDRARDVFHSAAVGHAKPERAFFEAVRLRLGVAPEEILLVGDDPVADLGGARAAGWQAVLLDRQGRYDKESTLRSLRDLESLLVQLGPQA